MSLDERTLMVDPESCLVGLALTHPEYVNDIACQVGEVDFTNPDLRAIWVAIGHLWASGELIDIALVKSELDRRGTWNKGILDAALSSMESFASPAPWRAWVKVLRDRTTRRVTKASLEAAIAKVASPDADIDAILSEVSSLTGGRLGEGQGQLGEGYDLGTKLIERVYDVRDGKLDQSTIPTGIESLDDMLGGGLCRSELIVTGATTSTGKSSLATTITGNVLKDGGRVLFFSLEVSALRVTANVLGALASVDAGRIYRGSLTDQELEAIRVPLPALTRLVVDDSSSLTSTQARSRARMAHQRTPLSLVVLDYLQFGAMDLEAGNRNLQVAAYSQAMKQLAKDLNVPVLLVSQLNRSSFQGLGKQSESARLPQLSDLRDSGSIEQDTDVVLLLHRPGKNKSAPSQEDIGNTTCLVAKNRNGRTGGLNLWFRPNFSHFSGES